MHISDVGLGIIKEFEGYKEQLPNGDCVAYQCVVGYRGGRPIYDGKWTIGWGCTEGVHQGMVWSRNKAEERLRQEVEGSEEAVLRCLTVTLNQNQFDACVSLAYNIGAAGFAGSSIARRLNAGDPGGAAAAFGMWVNSNGVRNVPGLVRRRKLEAALFLKPAADEDKVMPQTVDAPAVTEEHAEAHDLLDHASTLYARHGSLIRTTGWSMPPGLLAIWNWVADPLHLLLLVSGAALTVVVLLELSRLYQRNKMIGRPA